MPDFNSPLGRFGFIERWIGKSERRVAIVIAFVLALAALGGSIAP